MVHISRVDHLFQIIDNTALLLEEHTNLSYLEALVATGENIFQERIGQAVSNEVKNALESRYEQFFQEGMTDEDVRRAFQLALLKGMKASTQPQHQMTPDGIILFVSYLVGKWVASKEVITLLDPAVGTANLLTGIMNNINNQVVAMGVEVDPDLLRIGIVNANLQQKPIEFFHQDSLKPLLIDPVDMIVSDVPVGYYADEENSKSFRTAPAKGKAYSHFLMIEQGLKYTKPGGCLVYLVPNQLFEMDKERRLHQLLLDEALILGLLKLPNSLFSDPSFGKSILLLQKKAVHVNKPKQVLLADLPHFSNQQAFASIIHKIDDWFQDYHKINS